MRIINITFLYKLNFHANVQRKEENQSHRGNLDCRSNIFMSENATQNNIINTGFDQHHLRRN